MVTYRIRQNTEKGSIIYFSIAKTASFHKKLILQNICTCEYTFTPLALVFHENFRPPPTLIRLEIREKRLEKKNYMMKLFSKLLAFRTITPLF